MAINATAAATRRHQYTGNNSTTTFSFSFVIYDQTEISVYFDGTLKSLSTHYTVSISSDGTGSITTTSGNTAGTGVLVTIIGAKSIGRTSTFVSGGPLTADGLESEFNNQTILLQQLDERISRCVQLAINTDATTPIEFPYDNTESDNANRIIKFNSAGSALEIGSTSTNVDTIAGIASDVTTVSGISANVTTVAGKATEIGRLGTAAAVADMAILGTADVVADMNTLATSDIVSDLNTLATSDIVTDLNLLATSANVTNMATLGASGVVSNIATVSGSIANVNTVASNVSGVNDFAARYRVASSDPSSSLDAGDLVFNTSANELKYYTGSAWTSVAITDSLVKISGNDTTQGLLGAKLTATGSTGITLTETSDGSNETLNITAASMPNASLANSAITVNGSAVSLGGSVTVGETKPTISSISPSTIPNTATAVTITGTNFVTVPQVEAINPSTGIWYIADSVSFTNATTIVATFTLAVDATYKLRVENPDGLSVLSSSALLTVSDAPTWSTTAGSLGEVDAGAAVSLDVDASSDSTVAFSETTSILTSNANTPASTMNLTLNSSTGAITGTAPSSTSETTYNFTLRATDAESQTADRAFSITVAVGMNNSGQFN